MLSDVIFTHVQVTPNYSEVFVFWKTSYDQSCTEKLSQELDKKASDLRFELNQMSTLGRVPRIVFVQDYNVSANQLDQIYEQISLMQEASEQQQTKVQEEPDHGILRTDVLNFNREKLMSQIIQALEMAKAQHRNT